MVNHSRTLLLNRSGGGQSLHALGEEYIPEPFRAVSLPVWLRAYWETLLGTAPDNTYRNFVIDRLLRVVHATDYGGYLLTEDCRITYDPMAAGPFADAAYQLSWTVATGLTHLQSVDILGTLAADEKVGIMAVNYHLSWSSGVVTVTNLRTQNITERNVYESANLSKDIALPDTDMKLRMFFGSAVSSDWTGTMTLSTLARPVLDLSAKIATCDQLQGHAHTLFGREAVEPYLTLYGLWRQSQLPDRVAGLVLAMICRIHDIWRSALGARAATLSSPSGSSQGNGSQRSPIGTA
jgi:hypothetical protein